MLIKTKHEVQVPADDGKPSVFYWHFQRGMLAPRMSALELATFVLHHMPHVLPFFVGHPRVYSEFAALLVLFATQPAKALDEVMPWIQSVTRTGPDDIIVMTLDPTKQPDTRRKQVMFY